MRTLLVGVSAYHIPWKLCRWKTRATKKIKVDRETFNRWLRAGWICGGCLR